MRSIALIASFAALGGFLFGYDLGLIGGAMLDIEDAFNTTDTEEAAIVGAAKAGAVLGTFFGGAYMYRFGRLKAIAVDSVFFVVGPLVMAVAQNVSILVLGRFIIGLGVGTSAVVVPAYLGEMAPPSIRGAVIIMYEIMLCIGMMSSTLVDACLQSLPNNWRWMVGSPVVPALLLGVAPWLLPESPRWLVMRGDLSAAVAALHEVKYSQRITPGVDTSTPEVEHELMLLWDAVERDRAAGGGSVQPRSCVPRAGVLRVPLEHDHDTNAAHAEDGALSAAVEPSGDSASVHASGAAWRDRPAGPGAAERNVFADSDVFGSATLAIPDGSERGSNALGTSEAVVSISLNDLPEKAASAEEAPSAAEKHPASGQSGQEDGAKEHLYDLHAPFWRVLGQQIASSARLLAHAVGSGRPADAEAAGERRAVRIALLLAIFNQIGASTSLINYAPEVLQDAGVDGRQRAMQLSAAIGGCKTIGILFGITLVDKAGRRPLLLVGSAGCAVAMAALAYGRFANSLWLTLGAMCVYMFSFSSSWAGVFWVLCSEVFSMSIKSAAMSLATAALFAAGAGVDFAYPSLVSALDGGAFAGFAALAAAGGVYVYIAVPETRGLSLMEIQHMLQYGAAREPQTH
eukprot:jgi/Ulvmu1/8500/UM044_0034.1